MEIGKHQEITVYKYSYLLTKLHIVSKMKEAGVVMTGAGATYPYGHDPKDSNIRIAPTLPTPEELAEAASVFVLCVKLVTVDKLLEA